MKNTLYIDFETYFSTKEKYDLRSMDIVSYIRDSRFHNLGFGAAFGDDKSVWFHEGETWPFVAAVDWKNTAVIGHNIKFDGFILKERYGIIAGQYIDTMAMSRAVLGKTVRSHSLASLAEHFGLEAKGHLDTNGKNKLTTEEYKALAEYCLHDVELCRQVYERLAPEFPDNQYEITDQTIRMFVDPKLKLNVPLLETAAKEEALRRENIFKEIGIDKKEFASNVKFPALLESKGYTVPTKASPRRKDEKTGEYIQIPALALGDTEFLEMLEGENEELKALCEARVAAKSTLLETRSNKLAAIGRTGYWPFDVEFSGADQTHRFSGGSGAGGNPQNFTRGSALRQAVEAPEGYSLVVGDFSAIELRLQAYLSRDPGLLAGFEAGHDLYCDYASSFYKRTITKADKAERQFGKTEMLGLGYNMGWRKNIISVRQKTGQVIEEDTSRTAVDLYRTRYAQVPALWKTLENVIVYMTEKNPRVHLNLPVTLGFEKVILPSGLPIRFWNLRQEPNERGNMEWVFDVWRKGHIERRKIYGGKLLENICQGLAGELTKQAMMEVKKDTYGQLHDELMLVCKKGLEYVTMATLKRAMTTSPSWLPQLKLEAEIHQGRNWLECK